MDQPGGGKGVFGLDLPTLAGIAIGLAAPGGGTPETRQALQTFQGFTEFEERRKEREAARHFQERQFQALEEQRQETRGFRERELARQEEEAATRLAERRGIAAAPGLLQDVPLKTLEVPRLFEEQAPGPLAVGRRPPTSREILGSLLRLPEAERGAAMTALRPFLPEGGFVSRPTFGEVEGEPSAIRPSVPAPSGLAPPMAGMGVPSPAKPPAAPISRPAPEDAALLTRQITGLQTEADRAERRLRGLVAGTPDFQATESYLSRVRQRLQDAQTRLRELRPEPVDINAIARQMQADLRRAGDVDSLVIPVPRFDEFGRPAGTTLQIARTTTPEERVARAMIEAQARLETKATTTPRLPMSAEQASHFLKPDTLAAVPAGTSEADAVAQGFRFIRPEVRAKLLQNLPQTEVVLARIRTLSNTLLTAPTAPMAYIQGGRLTAGAFLRTNEEATVFADQTGTFIGVLSRSLAAERGVLTEGDIQRMRRGLPNFFDTAGIARKKMVVFTILSDTIAETDKALAFGLPIDLKQLRLRIDRQLEALSTVSRAHEDQILKEEIKRPPTLSPHQRSSPRGR